MTKTQKNDWYVTKIKMLFMNIEQWLCLGHLGDFKLKRCKIAILDVITYFTVFCTTLIHISCSSAT